MRLRNNINRTQQYLYAVLVPLLIVVLCLPLRDNFTPSIVAFILLLSLSFLAMVGSIKPVLLAAIVSALSWDFFYLQPHHHLIIDNVPDIIRFSTFFAVALINVVFTNRIRTAEKLLMEKEEKANALRLYDTIFSSLSHELRTPVTTIAGCTESLMKYETTMSLEDKQMLMNEISKASNRLSSQINNLLDMSRLQSGTIKPRKSWCDVGELIQDLVEGLKQDAMYHKMVVQVDADMPLVMIDYGLIEHSLLNLVNNALQYTPVGSTIKLAASFQKGHLFLTVEDDGPGIPENEHYKAFDKFYRGSTSTPGGTGLGLSIVKGYVEAHGGEISLKKSDMGGAKFIINIPVYSKNFYET